MARKSENVLACILPLRAGKVARQEQPSPQRHRGPQRKTAPKNPELPRHGNRLWIAELRSQWRRGTADFRAEAQRRGGASAGRRGGTHAGRGNEQERTRMSFLRGTQAYFHRVEVPDFPRMAILGARTFLSLCRRWIFSPGLGGKTRIPILLIQKNPVNPVQSGSPFLPKMCQLIFLRDQEI